MNFAFPASATPHQPRHPKHDVPEEFEPGSLPVEPDQGPVPATMPDDPQRERLTHPEQ